MDFESVDTDMENPAFDATPETNYFKMMMEDNQTGRVHNDNMDDSVTLASMMDNNSKEQHRENGNSSSRVGNVTNANTHNNPNAHVHNTMSIVGVEDDVSTIANDTVNETTKDFFSNHGTGRMDSKPRIRLFKEYTTPEKKKHKSNNREDIPNDTMDDHDNDNDTEPETPPGMIQVPGKGSSSSSSHRIDHARKEMSSSLNRSNRVYIIAGVLALVLFLSIIALSVALKGMRGGNDNDDSDAVIDHASSSVNFIEDGKDFESDGNNILDVWPDLDASPYTDDSTPLEATTPSPMVTSQPSTVNSAPSFTPTMNKDADFAFTTTLDVLKNRGIIPYAASIESNVDSPRYRATEWISMDPNYYDYSEDRIIQRWTLANFAYTWDVFSTSEQQQQQRNRRRRQRRRLQDVSESWLTYTNECDWYTSASAELSTCDENGMYRRLDIKDMELGGSLPAELSLLSNSLRHINLDGNNLEGNIPLEFRNLSNLESLHLRRNKFSGSISLNFGRLSNLETLELGKNEFTGKIPVNILMLGSLKELHLDNNSLNSVIPWKIGDLDSLVKLALNDNNLSGWVPDSLANLLDLQLLTLGNNNLLGSIPREVCRFDNIEVLSVDCTAQGCECCTECATTRPPSEFPTLAPTKVPSSVPTKWPSPAPTLNPTNVATLAPSSTLAPTQCISSISVLNDCYEQYADVEVSLESCNPDSDDWVGLYLIDAANFDSENLQNPNMWSWACGTRNCREAVDENIILMNADHAGNGEWPLELGIYVAVTARNSAQPYTAFAVSEAFIIEEVCPTN